MSPMKLRVPTREGDLVKAESSVRTLPLFHLSARARGFASSLLPRCLYVAIAYGAVPSDVLQG
jgi:hypothetical protein